MCDKFCNINLSVSLQKSGRLIYAGQDDWVHVNCALWSAEVFEHVDGSLHRVHSAIWRGRCLVRTLLGGRHCGVEVAFEKHRRSHIVIVRRLAATVVVGNTFADVHGALQT